jgi:hypothetical protein
MKVCIWTTSLQADTLALAIAMDKDPAIELIIVTKGKDAIVSEPIFKFIPLGCQILDRKLDDYASAIKGFNPDIVYADNHLPTFSVPDKFLYHWHGLPLKIRPAKDLKAFHRHTNRLIGNTKKPNPRFLAQCYGNVDYEHRVNKWQLAKENCRIWGSAFADLLLSPPYQKRDLEGYFDLDLTSRKTVLLSITWHFGDKIFGVLGDDDKIFEGIVKIVNDMEANLIISMHDRYRYNPVLIEKIEKYANKCSRSFIKYKSEHVDNLADLVASDVMICSFSSFIVFHYFTGKPSIHILPVDEKKAFIRMPAIKNKKVANLWRRNSDNLWMYPFSENGGLVPENGKALVQNLEQALIDQNYGKSNADQFITNRIHMPDGNTCHRMLSDMKAWVNE